MRKGICRIKTICNKGILNTIVIGLNVCLYYVFCAFPTNKKLIVLESDGDLCDNSYALYDYMRTEGYLKRYHIIWLVYKDKKYRRNEYENTSFVSKRWEHFSIIRSYYLARCKYYIYDHIDMLAKLKKKKGNVRVYLCHGFAGYKAQKGEKTGAKDDYVMVTGEIPAQLIPLWRWVDNARVLQLGFPRMDYFVKTDRKQVNEIRWKLGIPNESKLYLWMPTFRKSVIESLSEEYINSETGLPLVGSFEMVDKFNDYLHDLGDYLILKVHHLQSELDIAKRSYSNIKVLSDTDIQRLGYQLYEFITCTDALISDYSSISADYMALDKPMIFILDDYDEFNRTRGIIPDNALELMTGDHVYSYGELVEALLRIHNGEDKFKTERNNLLPHYHTNLDGMASKRILDYLGID